MTHRHLSPSPRVRYLLARDELDRMAGSLLRSGRTTYIKPAALAQRWQLRLGDALDVVRSVMTWGCLASWHWEGDWVVATPRR